MRTKREKKRFSTPNDDFVFAVELKMKEKRNKITHFSVQATCIKSKTKKTKYLFFTHFLVWPHTAKQ